MAVQSLEERTVVDLGGGAATPVGSPTAQKDLGGRHSWRRQWIAASLVVEVVVGARHCKGPP